MSTTLIDIIDITKKIGYVFKNPDLLTTAFIHSSYGNEKKIESYERLEFLGDSILNFIIARRLFDDYPDKNEGFLTKMRAGIVSEESLSMAISKLDIVKHVCCTGNLSTEDLNENKPIMCDIFESVLGAIYLDSGSIEQCEKYVFSNLESRIDNVGIIKTDFKSLLYEKCAKNGYKLEFVVKNLPDGCFATDVVVDGKVYDSAIGKTIKEASKIASKSFLSSSESKKLFN